MSGCIGRGRGGGAGDGRGGGGGEGGGLQGVSPERRFDNIIATTDSSCHAKEKFLLGGSNILKRKKNTASVAIISYF